MIRRLFVGASKHAFNWLYRRARKSRRGDEIVFLSRQTDAPSYDFVQLADEFRRRGWQVTMHLKKVSARRMPSYVGHVCKEIRYLGRCKIAVLDRYDPVVSLLDFECDTLPEPDAVQNGPATVPVNRELPRKPVIFQMWHAFGAFKKFGYQSVDTPEGHSADFTDTFRIHRNYSWVMCSGEGARTPFAQAFSCPRERVVAMDRPAYDDIMQAKARRDALDDALRSHRALMAPTLRINRESRHPFRDLYGERSSFESACGVDIVWSFHPLEEGLPAPGKVSDQLLECSLLVTDYSSIVYEAYLLHIPVVFYVPDIEDYLKSPGLNVNPMETSAEICASNEEELASLIARFVGDERSYPFDALERFAGSAFAIDADRSAASASSRIADFLEQAARA